MIDALEEHAGTISIGGRLLSNLQFADDIVGLAGKVKPHQYGAALWQNIHCICHGDQCWKKNQANGK